MTMSMRGGTKDLDQVGQRDLTGFTSDASNVATTQRNEVDEQYKNILGNSGES